MNSFEFINETTEEIKELIEVKNVVKYALKQQKIENAIFNIIFVDEEKIKYLNKNYRNKD